MDKESGMPDQIESRSTVHRSLANSELFILGLTVYSLIVAAAIILDRNPSREAILYWSDMLVCLVFLVDFLMNLRHAPAKMNFLLKQGGWLDLIGSIPVVPGLPWTALFRLARLSRVVRIIRGVGGQERDEVAVKTRGTMAGTALLSMGLLSLVLLTVISLLILRFERGAPDAFINNGTEAFWWAFVTMTTVGYGDFVPVTNAGRVLAIFLMTFGIGVFAVLTSFLASKFVIEKDEQEDAIAIVRQENATIRAELAEIKELLNQCSGRDGGGR